MAASHQSLRSKIKQGSEMGRKQCVCSMGKIEMWTPRESGRALLLQMLTYLMQVKHKWVTGIIHHIWHCQHCLKPSCIIMKSVKLVEDLVYLVSKFSNNYNTGFDLQEMKLWFAVFGFPCLWKMCSQPQEKAGRHSYGPVFYAEIFLGQNWTPF